MALYAKSHLKWMEDNLNLCQTEGRVGLGSEHVRPGTLCAFCTLDGVHLYCAKIQIDILTPLSMRLTPTYACEAKLLTCWIAETPRKSSALLRLEQAFQAEQRSAGGIVGITNSS